MSPLLFVALSIVGNVCGQLLLKKGMVVIARAPGNSVLVRMITSPWVIGGMVIYGSGVVFWIIALSYLQLSFVYPFGSLGYIGIMIGSYVLFKEPISRLRLVGIGIIVFGLLLISQS
ncbi:MAG: DMT family transporter [Aggregatilineales bacterium]